MSDRAARVWHGVTFALATATLLLQLGLVISGESVLDETTVPPLDTRLVRLVSYFTIQSNLLVAVVSWSLLRMHTGTGRYGAWSGRTRCSGSSSPAWSTSSCCAPSCTSMV